MSRFVPTAAELMDAVGRVLDEVLDAVPEHRRHEVRVAASLTRIVGRELRERDSSDGTDGASLPADESDLWRALVSMTRADLAIVKPGYEAWEFG